MKLNLILVLMIMNKIINFFVLILVINVATLAADPLERRVNSINLHIDFISEKADVIGLSNESFFVVSSEDQPRVAHWNRSDFVTKSFKVKGQGTLKGPLLLNKRTNEEICVKYLGITPSLETLNPQAFPYLHLKYVERANRLYHGGRVIILSDDVELYVRNVDMPVLLSWDLSDVLVKGKISYFSSSSSRLYNKTKGASIPATTPPMR